MAYVLKWQRVFHYLDRTVALGSSGLDGNGGLHCRVGSGPLTVKPSSERFFLLRNLGKWRATNPELFTV